MNIANFWRFTAFSIIGTVSLLPLLVLPAMIGVLVDNAAMSESSAGWSASANFMAGAVTGLILAVRIHHLNLRQLTTVALVLALIADTASALSAGENTLFFCARIIAGMMLGVSYISSVSAFSRFADYERGFGLFVTLQFIISGLGLYIVPVFADDIGAGGLFLGFAFCDIIALCLAQFLPIEKPAQLGHSGPTSELQVLFTASALLAIIGFAVFEAANNAQFTYIERFGVALSVSDHDIGKALLIASLAGIPGAFSIVIIGQRFGTLLPLTFGIVIAISGLILLSNSKGYTGYFIGGCCMGFSWAFCLPFIQSLLAKIDRNGSAIAAGSSLSTFGSAVGPGMAAVIVGGENYHGVFLFSILLFVVALSAFYLASKTGVGQV